MRKAMLSLIVVVWISAMNAGCVTYINSNGIRYYSILTDVQEPPKKIRRELLKDHFEPLIIPQLAQSSLIIVDSKIYYWNYKFKFTRLGGWTEFYPEKQKAIILLSGLEKQDGLTFDEAWIHEYLHVAWFIVLNDKQRTTWNNLWTRYKSYFPSFEQRDNHIEAWAYIGQFIVVRPDWSRNYPLEIVKSYRGILNEEFLKRDQP